MSIVVAVSTAPCHVHACVCMHAGVYLSLNDVIYANNSVIPITDIGETSNMYTTSNTGLQCITDRRPCCNSRPNRSGQWFFPDGTTVPSSSYYYYNSLFYRNRGDDGTVNLNRVNASVMMPTGQFYCMVHDAADTEQIVCVDIGILNMHVGQA